MGETELQGGRNWRQKKSNARLKSIDQKENEESPSGTVRKMERGSREFSKVELDIFYKGERTRAMKPTSTWCHCWGRGLCH